MSTNNASFGYDYFCGANVYIKVNGQAAIEAAGISYQVQDSTSPIYGYSSRIFDAVAVGQKIIKGSLIINFVHPHYLSTLVNSGLDSSMVDSIGDSINSSFENYRGSMLEMNRGMGYELAAAEKAYDRDIAGIKAENSVLNQRIELLKGEIREIDNRLKSLGYEGDVLATASAMHVKDTKMLEKMKDQYTKIVSESNSYSWGAGNNALQSHVQTFQDYYEKVEMKGAMPYGESEFELFFNVDYTDYQKWLKASGGIHHTEWELSPNNNTLNDYKSNLGAASFDKDVKNWLYDLSRINSTYNSQYPNSPMFSRSGVDSLGRTSDQLYSLEQDVYGLKATRNNAAPTAFDFNASVGEIGSMLTVKKLLNVHKIKQLVAKANEAQTLLSGYQGDLAATDAKTNEYNQRVKSIKAKYVESEEYKTLTEKINILAKASNVSLAKKKQIDDLLVAFEKDVKDGALDPNAMRNYFAEIEKFASEFYNGLPPEAGVTVPEVTDIGLLGPFSIDIQYAEDYTIRIIDAFFTSRGSMIQIDESAIVEEYTFFARDIIGLRT